MAIDGTATIDRESDSLAAGADVAGPQIDELFCGCGTLREPMPSGGLSCPDGCTQVGSGKASLVLEIPQEKRGDLTIADGSELQDNDGLEYTRRKHCGACEEEQEVEARVAQTRSADEPPTRQYTCRDCGKRWREHG